MPSHWCRWRLSGAVQYLVGAVMPSGGRPANRQLLEAGRAIFSASSRWLAPEVQGLYGDAVDERCALILFSTPFTPASPRPDGLDFQLPCFLQLSNAGKAV